MSKTRRLSVIAGPLLFPILLFALAADSGRPAPLPHIPGFHDAREQLAREQKFLAVPDARRAEEHLKVLTAEPHLAGSPGDKRTADYVARKFREAGLETEVREYKVWMNLPAEISVAVTAPAGVKMRGPTRERVPGDPFQDHPDVVDAFNGFSPSGEVEAEVVYANYGRPEDFKHLAESGADLRGKIAVVRYGANFRGVKVFVAEQYGIAGVILYSDPIDDGYFKGDAYPRGPWRPSTAVQRGSVKYGFRFPGDPTTPGVASRPDLPDSERVPPQGSSSLPSIPVTPLSAADAQPILENLGGPLSPRHWQGGLPFPYHVGPGPVRVHLKVKQEYGYHTIWNVIGRVPGRELPEEWVVAGNHRDAWVFGAVDPSSGTAALLETVAGIGELLKSGWRPRRTIVFASWDAEEQSLIGSTEWVEEHAQELKRAVAYFNMDTGGAGPNFGASAVPSLKQFVREITKAVPSPRGGTVYQSWRSLRDEVAGGESPLAPEAHVGNLGSGSDYTPFVHVVGVPATDVRSTGPYGVYHSVFDNFAWFKKFADPEFVYSQQMARVYGLQVLRMADADVLPYDYETYGKDVLTYLENARVKAEMTFGRGAPSFAVALRAARRFARAGVNMSVRQRQATADAAALNRALRDAESALLLPEGLPHRPFYRHPIFAPGEYTGYAAVVLPGVNEAIDAGDRSRLEQQLAALAAALTRSARVLERGVAAPRTSATARH